MNEELKKYAAYDPETFKFIGFYNEDRKDLPENVIEVPRATFLTDKGQHTHINPDIGYYTPPATEEEKRQKRRLWRIGILRETDKFMLEDYPIDAQQRIELLAFRQALRDYPETGIRPTVPPFIEESM